MIDECLISEAVIELQVHCTELYENEVYTKVLGVMKSEYIPSIEYFRKLIERELGIPRVCQLSLSVAGIPLDPLETMEECCLSHRLFMNPNPITLHYYTTSLNLRELSKLFSEIENAMRTLVLNDILNHFDSLVSYQSKFNWKSKSALNTAMYFSQSGFLQRLKFVLIYLNEQLADGIYDLNVTDESAEIAIEEVISCISIILRFLWHLGGSWELCVYVSELGFTRIFLHSFLLATKVAKQTYSAFELQNSCFGAINLVVDQKPTSYIILENEHILNLLKDAFLCKNFIHPPYTIALLSVMFFYIANYPKVSTRLFDNGIFIEILEYFLVKGNKSTDGTDVRINFDVCMLTLNILRTPRLSVAVDNWTYRDNMAKLLANFIRIASVKDLVQYEEIHSYSWTNIEYFFTFFLVPKNSILGNIMSHNPLSDIVKKYFELAHIILEVRFRQTSRRELVFTEKLLALLVIVDWKYGNIIDKLRVFFPDLLYTPVPSLHDIAAISAFSAGLGEYSELMHS